MKKVGYITLHLGKLGVEFGNYTQIHLYKSLKEIRNINKDIYKVEIKLTKINGEDKNKTNISK